MLVVAFSKGVDTTVSLKIIFFISYTFYIKHILLLSFKIAITGATEWLSR